MKAVEKRLLSSFNRENKKEPASWSIKIQPLRIGRSQ